MWRLKDPVQTLVVRHIEALIEGIENVFTFYFLHLPFSLEENQSRAASETPYQFANLSGSVVWSIVSKAADRQTSLLPPGKHDTLAQCWCNAGPASQTMGQHHISIGPTCRAVGVYTLKRQWLVLASEDADRSRSVPLSIIHLTIIIIIEYEHAIVKKQLWYYKKVHVTLQRVSFAPLIQTLWFIIHDHISIATFCRHDN